MFIARVTLEQVITHIHTTLMSLALRQTYLDGYCSTVQGLLDLFEVDLGFTKLLFIQTDVSRVVRQTCDRGAQRSRLLPAPIPHSPGAPRGGRVCVCVCVCVCVRVCVCTCVLRACAHVRFHACACMCVGVYGIQSRATANTLVSCVGHTIKTDRQYSGAELIMFCMQHDSSSCICVT